MTPRVLRLASDRLPRPVEPVAAEKVLAGAALQGLANLFTSADGKFFAGFWSSSAGRWRVNYREDELCLLLGGEVVLTDAEGREEHFAPGEAFVIPAGFSGTWESLGEVRKLYAIYEP